MNDYTIIAFLDDGHLFEASGVIIIMSLLL